MALGDLTPQQRIDLILRIDAEMLRLGMDLVPALSHQYWKLNGDAVRIAYNNLAESVRTLCLNVWVSTPHNEVDLGPWGIPGKTP